MRSARAIYRETLIQKRKAVDARRPVMNMGAELPGDGLRKKTDHWEKTH